VQTRFQSPHPVNISFYLLNISSYAWVLFWQLKLWLDMYNVQKRHGVQTLSWALSSFAALILPIFFLLFTFFLMGFNEIFLYITAFASIVIGILTFQDTFWKKRDFSVSPLKNPFGDFNLVIQGIFILSGFITMTLMMGYLMIPYNIVEITIKAIPPLGGFGDQSISAFDLIINDYLLPFTLFPWIFISNFLSLFLLVWTVRNTFDFLRKYALHLPDEISTLDLD
jgi:hypothetical protein